MPNFTEINRGKDARAFREKMKRSLSRKNGSADRGLQREFQAKL